MSPPILAQQIAAWIDKPGPHTTPTLKYDIPIPVPGPGEVLIKLEYTGVCHSDVHAIRGETKRMAVHIGGHEGVGHIAGFCASDPPSPFPLNSRVAIKWLASACLDCEICAINRAHCPRQHNFGRDVPGAFQQYVVADSRFVTRIPEGLESERVAPLLCAGLTAYGAVKKAGVKKGEWIVILGAGGLGHLGLQIAKVRGYRVIAVDTGAPKRALCERLLGGEGVFLDYKTDDVEKEVKALTAGYGAHAVLCLTGNDAAYELAFKLVRILGTIVCVGLTVGQLRVSPFEVAIRSLRVLGSSVGTEEDMEELLAMAVRGEVVANVEVYKLEDLWLALRKLGDGDIVGRAVVKIPA